MKPMESLSFVILSLLITQASAHFLFGHLIVNNTWSEGWEYVREVKPYLPNFDDTGRMEYAYTSPILDPDSTDMRCGRDASVPFTNPKTAVVRAGDTVGFALGPILYPYGYDDPPEIFHPGPASAWLSKSPVENLTEYHGDGDWFKILSVIGRTKQSYPWEDGMEKKNLWTQWGMYGSGSWNFTIPRTTPPGFYLLRFEHIFPGENDSQFYPNCAHVQIVNDDAEVGTPGPLVKIPGVYKLGQPEVYFDSVMIDDQFYGNQSWRIETYVPPKPDPWTG